MNESWPPDWRLAKADAADAIHLRSGEFLVVLDEVQELFADSENICSFARQLAGFIRAERSELRLQADTYRMAVGQMADA